MGEKRSTVRDADRDEIHRDSDRNRVEALEVLSVAHAMFPERYSDIVTQNLCKVNAL